MEELIQSLDLGEMNYYYHITSHGLGDDILENGLYLENKDLSSTTVKLSNDILENFENYCKDEYVDNLVKRQEMVIIGVPKDEEDYLVEKAYIPKKIDDRVLNYFINSENILGYIDLETLEVIYNLDYIHNFTL